MTGEELQTRLSALSPEVLKKARVMIMAGTETSPFEIDDMTFSESNPTVIILYTETDISVAFENGATPSIPPSITASS